MVMGRGFDNVFVGEINDVRYVAFKQLTQAAMTPKKVIFNNPATIVYWEDGSKTVVKCGADDIYDREKGFAMCVLKQLYGDNFHAVLKKHVPQEETKEDSQEKVDYQAIFEEVGNNFLDGILDGIFAWSKEQKIKPMTFQSKKTLWPDGVAFNNREDAEQVLWELVNLIKMRRFAYVSDLYDFIDVDSTYADTKYGWYDLTNASIKHTRDGYILDLPRPVRHI